MTMGSGNMTMVPIQPGSFNIHVEVICEPVHDHVESGALFLPLLLVIGDQVRVAVPELPKLTRIDPRVLNLVQQLIVDGLKMFFIKA